MLKTGNLTFELAYQTSLNMFQSSRFQLYYYSDFEFKKEERKETVLTIDTRTKLARGGTENKNNMMEDDLDDGVQEPPLQLAIKTK